jgi:hypothetical protein
MSDKQLGTCDKKQYEHAGPHERIGDCSQSMPPFPCVNWKSDPIHAPAEPQPDPTASAESTPEPPKHKWTGCRRGGSPAEADSYEYVRYCEVCGMEDTCEDPLPPCVTPEQPSKHEQAVRDVANTYVQTCRWTLRESLEHVRYALDPEFTEGWQIRYLVAQRELVLSQQQEIQELRQALKEFKSIMQRGQMLTHLYEFELKVKALLAKEQPNGE